MGAPFYDQIASQGSAGSSILGALPLIGGLVSGVSQIFTNRANRRWQEEMYGRQRADALADWNMMNLYNSPEQQMQRLKEAGLNPNLVYGTGATANTAQGVRATQPAEGRAQAPEFNLQQGIFAGIDLKLKQQQLENQKATNAAIISEIARKNAGTANLMQATARGKQQFDFFNDTRKLSIDIMNEQLRRFDVGTDVMIAENERKAAMNAQNLQRGVEEIARIRQQTANSMKEYVYWSEKIKAARLDNELRQWSVDLSKQGVKPNDPLWQRKAAEFLNKPLGKQMIEGFKKAWYGFHK